MPINKFTTLLDLSRQAKIITGETATFDGKILAGIPFSGYPTGVNTATTVSLGVVSTENAVFSGNTGTTVFDVSNPLSPYYNPLFRETEVINSPSKTDENNSAFCVTNPVKRTSNVLFIKYANPCLLIYINIRSPSALSVTA